MPDSSHPTPQVRPVIDGEARRPEALARREKAAERSGPDDYHMVFSNGEEEAFGFVPVSNFSKGLRHDALGFATPQDYKAFVNALSDFDRDGNNVGRFDVPGAYDAAADKTTVRQFESPLAGLYYSIEGPDPAAVGMAPPPKLGSSELCAEMAEVYALALLRDMPFSSLDKPDSEIFYIDEQGRRVSAAYPSGHSRAGQVATLGDLVDELKKISFLNPAGTPFSSRGGTDLSEHEDNRRQARWIGGDYTINSLFYGSSPKAKAGPLVSQFLLLGTRSRAQLPGGAPRDMPSDGRIQFGAQNVDQRVEQNRPGLDFMTDWASWLEVQNAARPADGDAFFTGKRHFLTTPRDLATYVHYDQLYQAYFNACLIMLTNGVGVSPGFPNNDPASSRGAFATFGGPHILSLMTEVATRGLKAVRRQKFQIHRRARPEVIAARMTQVHNHQPGSMPAEAKAHIESMLNELGAADPTDESKPGVLLHWINEINTERNAGADGADWMTKVNFLLPMAFPEGSPMHPAYGAGHATVAGACVTVLKAFFDMDVHVSKALGVARNYVGDEEALAPASEFTGQSLAGELDKLAANISIGRNMAGVHYYTDYYDSLRLGERIAAGIIEEQMYLYPERVSMSFTDFDGNDVEIKALGDDAGTVEFNTSIGRDAWFDLHVKDDLASGGTS